MKLIKATGSTPIGTYRQLIEWYQKGDMDFSEVITVNQDEYCGLSPENPASILQFHPDFTVIYCE